MIKCHLRIAGQFPLAREELPIPTIGTLLRLDVKYTTLPPTLGGPDNLDIRFKGLILNLHLQRSLQIQVEQQRHVHQAHLHHQTGHCCTGIIQLIQPITT